jgi:EAL domain-containing protein (putative c-di-GMP-specific phosphodiesterase class I)
VDDGARPSPLLQGIVDLGKAMGLLVAAEGIETPSQEEALRACGCELAQGYLFAHPMDPDRFQDLLRSGRRLGASAAEAPVPSGARGSGGGAPH